MDLKDKLLVDHEPHEAFERPEATQEMRALEVFPEAAVQTNQSAERHDCEGEGDDLDRDSKDDVLEQMGGRVSK